MIKNERGSILPIMIAITFIVAYLLVMLATQIEVKAASYEHTRIYLKMNLLEREGLSQLEYFLETTEVADNFSEIWTLRDGATMTISGRKDEKIFAFSYQIVYNGHVYSRTLAINLENRTASD